MCWFVVCEERQRDFNMLFGCGLLLLLSCARTTGNLESNGLILSKGFDRSMSYSYWPSMLHAANMMRLRKRELQTEGGGVKIQPPLPPDASPAAPQPHSDPASASNVQLEQAALPPQSTDTENKPAQPLPAKQPEPVRPDEPNKDKPKVENPIDHPSSNLTTATNSSTEATKNKTTVIDDGDKVDLSSPGVVKRGVIVFGGFALLAVAYFIFYRRKSSKNDSNSSHNTTDANQFRYGVLQSEDRRDNLELSRIPLTMESDEDDDDYLEIFDLEQKRKSMSYVNLQVNDEEVVNGPPKQNSEDLPKNVY
ncbi:hypothetical protein ABMA27_015866 [Loxostege sticticalis]|uniref:Uncharacterized protein n=1 Tax=Loxostege sticticalis TaxID=481309 RepID=A0ABR3I4L6_LOXSC